MGSHVSYFSHYKYMKIALSHPLPHPHFLPLHILFPFTWSLLSYLPFPPSFYPLDLFLYILLRVPPPFLPVHIPFPFTWPFLSYPPFPHPPPLLDPFLFPPTPTPTPPFFSTFSSPSLGLFFLSYPSFPSSSILSLPPPPP